MLEDFSIKLYVVGTQKNCLNDGLENIDNFLLKYFIYNSNMCIKWSIRLILFIRVHVGYF